MDKAKDEADDGRTPFERMREFAARILSVPKEEVAERAEREPRKPKPQRQRKRRHSG